jgi:hypothetical protein
VTYDIYFVRREAGRTLLQTLEAANAGFDPDSEPEPMRLTPGQRAAWDRIVERLTRELGPATCEEFPYCLILRREGPAGVVQLDFSGKSAAISMQYRYSDRLALPVITEAYHIATLVEQETGLARYDPRADQPTAGGDLALAAGRLIGLTGSLCGRLGAWWPPAGEHSDRPGLGALRLDRAPAGDRES